MTEPAHDSVITDSVARAWTGTDHTVLGYYLNIPRDYLVSYEGYSVIPAGKDNAEARKKLISEKRIADGYLRLSGNPEVYVWEGWVDLALFNNSSPDSKIFAVFHYSCGPGCHPEPGFFRYRDNHWSDITESVFPLVSPAELRKKYAAATGQPVASSGNPQLIYELHPESNSILLLSDPQFEDGKRVVFATLKLTGGKFVLAD